MREDFSINEILEAVNLLLNSKIKKKPIDRNKKRNDILPIDTEKIISQAEKYIRKK